MTEPEAFRQAISKMNPNDEEEGKNHLISTAPDVNSHPTQLTQNEFTLGTARDRKIMKKAVKNIKIKINNTPKQSEGKVSISVISTHGANQST